MELKSLLIGAQMLFVAFGALVLVPVLTGLDPGVALFTAGLGTLIFQVCTKGKVPVFLASSFAFIAPIIYGVENWGIPATMSGLVAAGLIYVLLSIVIKIKGSDFIHKLFPPVVTGSVIMVIGLTLAPVGINMAKGMSGDGAIVLVPMAPALVMSVIALLTAIIVAIFAGGILGLIPILVAITVAYIVAAFLGYIDLGIVMNAAWLAMPNFTTPEFNWQAILYIAPVALAPAIEHFGDVIAIGSVAKRDYLKDPGINKTLLGDGLATSVAAMLGGPPNTTYSEVTGAVALTKQTNPAIMTWAAIFAIAFAFCGKLNALLQTIPVPVMGGVMILLFGLIASVGVQSMVDGKTDFSQTKNKIIFSLSLVLSLGGVVLGAGKFQLGGIALAAVMAVSLNLILPENR